MERVFKILVVDDQFHNFEDAYLERMVAEGLIRVTWVSSLDELVEMAGIKYEAGKFRGKLKENFDYDIVLLDWKLLKTTIPSNLFAFAFIPYMKERYRWKAYGEQVLIIPYSQVWPVVRETLEGYLASLEMGGRDVAPSAEEVKRQLTEKGFEIVKQLSPEQLEILSQLLTSKTDEAIEINYDVEMRISTLFPLLHLYQNDGLPAAEIEVNKIKAEVERRALRESDLEKFCNQCVDFIRVTHNSVKSNKHRDEQLAEIYKLKHALSVETSDVSIQPSQTVVTIEVDSAAYKLPERVVVFIRDRLGEIETGLKALEVTPPSNMLNDGSLAELRNLLKRHLRLMYVSQKMEGYTAINEVADISSPDSSSSWVSYVFVEDIQNFISEMSGQLKGHGKLEEVIIDERLGIAYWCFTQKELLTDFEAIKNSKKWSSMWQFVEDYKLDLYALVTTEAAGRKTSRWRRRTGQHTEMRPDIIKSFPADVRFLLVMPTYKVSKAAGSN